MSGTPRSRPGAAGACTPFAERLTKLPTAAEAPQAWYAERAASLPPRPLFGATPAATAPAEDPAAAAAATAAETEQRRRELDAARDEAERVGLQAAQVKVEEIIERYLDGIQRLLTATRLAHRPEPGEVVALALMVAKEILGRELTVDRSALLATLDRALTSVSADTQLVVRVSPADAAYVRQRRPELVRAGVVLVEDRAIAVGGCIIETPAWVLDASIEARLDAVRESLVELLTTNPSEAETDADDSDDAAAEPEAARPADRPADRPAGARPPARPPAARPAPATSAAGADALEVEEAEVDELPDDEELEDVAHEEAAR